MNISVDPKIVEPPQSAQNRRRSLPSTQCDDRKQSVHALRKAWQKESTNLYLKMPQNHAVFPCNAFLIDSNEPVFAIFNCLKLRHRSPSPHGSAVAAVKNVCDVCALSDEFRSFRLVFVTVRTDFNWFVRIQFVCNCLDDQIFAHISPRKIRKIRDFRQGRGTREQRVQIGCKYDLFDRRGFAKGQSTAPLLFNNLFASPSSRSTDSLM